MESLYFSSGLEYWIYSISSKDLKDCDIILVRRAGRRDGSAINAGCSCRDLRIGSQHSQGGSQPSLTLVPDNVSLVPGSQGRWERLDLAILFSELHLPTAFFFFKDKVSLCTSD